VTCSVSCQLDSQRSLCNLSRIAIFVAGVGFGQTEPFVEFAGLWQRVCVVVGWALLTILALRLLRQETHRVFSPD
jgi:hypothetical protein